MFKDHLTNSKVTYLEHLTFAFYAGFRLLWAAIVSFIHALFPNLFPGTAAKIIIDIYHKRLANHPNKEYQNYIDKYQKK